MTPKDTIKSSVLNYPLISQTNGEIQHHLFIVVGNGYEWVNGELVDEYTNQSLQSTSDAISELFKEYKNENNIWCEKVKTTGKTCSFLNHLEKQVLTILKADTMFDEPLEVYFDKIKNEPLLLNICKYSKIYDLPDKITKEWYDCVVNFLNHFEPYINDTEEQKKYISEIKEKLKNITII